MHGYVPKEAPPKTFGGKCWKIVGCGGADDDRGERIPWIKTEQADLVFGAVILANAIVLGVDEEVTVRSGEEPAILTNIQIGFLVIFIVELMLRVCADGCAFFSISNTSGLFDVIIVSVSVFEVVANYIGADSMMQAVGVMRIFRLLRLARIARILHICPELMRLVQGLAASLKAVAWVAAFSGVLMYVCALVCAMELGTKDNEELKKYFGSVGLSFYTHFMVMTLENYPGVVRAAGKESWLWFWYFVVYIMFSTVVIMNLVIGIVCESVVSHSNDEDADDELANYELELVQLREVMSDLMTANDFDMTKDLDNDSFRRLIQLPESREALNAMDICMEIEDSELFTIMDLDGSGRVSVEELLSSMMRMRGSKEKIHSVIVQSDVIRGSLRIKGLLGDAESKLQDWGGKLCDALRVKMQERIGALKQELAPPDEGGASEGAAGLEGLPATPSGAAQRPERPRRQLQADTQHGAPPADLAASPQEPELAALSRSRSPPRSGSVGASSTLAAAGTPEARLLKLLEQVETGKEQASHTLVNLSVELAASRTRVEELEARIQQRRLEALGKPAPEAEARRRAPEPAEQEPAAGSPDGASATGSPRPAHGDRGWSLEHRKRMEAILKTSPRRPA